MQKQIAQLLKQSLMHLQDEKIITQVPDNINVIANKKSAHGDYASNIAMILAKQAKKTPQILATEIIAHLPSDNAIEKVEIAGAGFINFYIQSSANDIISTILSSGQSFGTSEKYKDQRVLLEFVSANPTGPLHVGHGRGAAYGACLAKLLTAVGYTVECEYYLNDCGRQMDILTVSIWLRYLSLFDSDIELPKKAYHGQYISQIATALKKKYTDTLLVSPEKISQQQNSLCHLDEEKQIDALIQYTQNTLSLSNYQNIFDLGLSYILEDIKNDLAEFGANFDRYYSENSLISNQKNKAVLDQLKSTGALYEKDGAWWLNSQAYGDNADRVVIRDNGLPTYLASDISYHLDKFQRGFDKIINIWGADHHGYIARVKAAMQMLDLNVNKLEILLVQFVSLYRDGKPLQMSTRSGSFITLRALREEVGNDAARFFYVMRKAEQHMDFDLTLAKQQNSDNPVFYIQYAHARICQVFKQAHEQQLSDTVVQAELVLLTNQYEQQLIKRLRQYPQILQNSALNHTPHRLAHYLKDLATDFHRYYNQTVFLVPDTPLRHARLTLIKAVQQVLKNALTILGVKAPMQM